jgi:FlaA1/EpsC-like NDP-sugar epimerase
MLKNILINLFKKNYPRWLVLVIDLYVVTNTFILSYLIRFNFRLSFDTSKLLVELPIVLGVAFLVFIVFGSYKGIVRHTGIKDSFIVSAASLGIYIILTSMVLLNQNTDYLDYFAVPLSITTIHFLLNVFVLVASRYLFKELYNLLFNDLSIEKRVIIYGAGEAGLITHSVLSENIKNKTLVVAFIDDNKKITGKRLNGVKVHDASSINKTFLEENNVDEIILSIQNIKPFKLLEIVDKISKLPVKLKIIPPVETWIESNLNSQQIKNVRIEDLLGRKSIEVNNPILRKEFNNKIVLITGAAGSIGSEIARQISRFNYKGIVLIDQAESDLYNLQQYFKQKGVKNICSIVADVRNSKRMQKILDQYHPDFIFHAAAYKHVPFMEEYPMEAVNVNICGTCIIADLALKNNVEKFVLVSTDKAVNPTNIMGATKRIAEMYVNCLNKERRTKFITTRFGNVLGSNGSVIPLFKNQIENGGPVTVTHKDISRYFMTISEACQLVLEACAMGDGGEIFVFDMGESLKIFDLAVNMIQLSGHKYPGDIDIEITGLRPGEKIYEELVSQEENST